MSTRAHISWLYVRGSETVYIRETGPLQLAICGPGADRLVRRFSTPDDLFQFNQQQANLLASSGFRYQGFGIERRSGSDRRRLTRSPVDRRTQD